jgi:hypothetical protein
MREAPMRANAILVFAGTAVLIAMPAAATQCVNPGGTGGCHASIQAAVNAAQDGETVHVHAGTYTEFTTIPEAGDVFGRILDIEGEGVGVTVIEGGFDISRQWKIRLRDLTITASGSDGARVHLGAAVEIRDCEVSNHVYNGIQAAAATISVVDSIVSGNGDGIAMSSGARAVVTGSTLSDNAGTALVASYAPGRQSVVEMATTVVENNAEGVMLFTARATVLDSTIRDNSFRGPYVNFSSRLTIERSTISGNSPVPAYARGSRFGAASCG